MRIAYKNDTQQAETPALNFDIGAFAGSLKEFFEKGLRDAAAKGDIEKLKSLIASMGGQLDAADRETSKRALHYAASAENNAAEAVQLLLDAGADVTRRDSDGNTAYDILRERSQGLDTNDPLVKTTRLLRETADAKLKALVADGGETDWGRISDLLDAGAGYDGLVGLKNVSLFDLSQLGNDHMVAAAQMLTANGNFDVTELMAQSTPFAYARGWSEDLDDPETKEAYSKLAEVFAAEAQGQLRDAVAAGDWTKAKDIIEADTGIDPRVDQVEGESILLSYAAGKGQLEVVKALVNKLPEGERAAFINRQDKNGRTAVHWAFDTGTDEVGEWLLEQGGDGNIKDNKGVAAKNQTSSNPEATDENREEVSLPAMDEIDIYQAQTTTKDKDGNVMTVYSRTIKEIYDKYKAELDDGKFGEDDARAKLVRTLEAKSALDAGMTIKTYREGKDGLDLGGMLPLLPEDLNDIMDPVALNAKLRELLQDETIAADFDAELKESVNEVSDKDQRAEDLKRLLTSKEYSDYIAKLRSDGNDVLAEADMQRSLSSLRALTDDETVDKVTQDILRNDLINSMEDSLKDPSKIPEESLDRAASDARDLLKSILGQLDVGDEQVKNLVDSLQAILDDPDKNAALIDALSSLAGSGYTADNPFEAIEKVVSALGLEGELKTEIEGALVKLEYLGIMPTLVGTARIGASIDKITGGEARSEDGLANIATSGGFLNYLALSTQMAELSPTLIQTLIMGSTFSTVLPESTDEDLMKKLWGDKFTDADMEAIRNGRVGGQHPAPAYGSISNYYKVMMEGIKINDEAMRAVGTKIRDAVPNTIANVDVDAILPVDNTDSQQRRVGNFIEEIEGDFNFKMPDAPTDAQNRTIDRAGASGARILTNVVIGGLSVVPVVFGAMDIKEGAKSGDSDKILAGALDIAAGGLGFAGVGAAAYSAATGSTVANVLARVFGGAATMLMLPVMALLFRSQEKEAYKDTQDTFQRWADAGLLEDDWKARLDFVASFLATAKDNRGSYEDRSLFEMPDWETYAQRMTEEIQNLEFDPRGGRVIYVNGVRTVLPSEFAIPDDWIRTGPSRYTDPSTENPSDQTEDTETEKPEDLRFDPRGGRIVEVNGRTTTLPSGFAIPEDWVRIGPSRYTDPSP